MYGGRNNNQPNSPRFPQVVEAIVQFGLVIQQQMDMMPHDIGMVNKQEAKQSVSIIMGNKQVEKSIVIGDILSMICDNQGVQIVEAMMKDVVLVPDCAFNLLSISKQLKQGWKLGSNSDVLVLTSPNGNNQIKFNIKILTPNGGLYAMSIKRKQEEVVGVATTNCENKKKVTMTLMQAHEKLGHINECTTKEISRILG